MTIKNNFKLVDRKIWFLATFSYVYPIRRRKRNYRFFTATGNVTMAEWPARAPWSAAGGNTMTRKTVVYARLPGEEVCVHSFNVPNAARQAQVQWNPKILGYKPGGLAVGAHRTG